jgi:catalase
MFVQEAYRHHKTIGAWGEGVDVLTGFGIPLDAPGVVTADAVDAGFSSSLLEAAGWHRHWERPSLVVLPEVART